MQAGVASSALLVYSHSSVIVSYTNYVTSCFISHMHLMHLGTVLGMQSSYKACTSTHARCTFKPHTCACLHFSLHGSCDTLHWWICISAISKLQNFCFNLTFLCGNDSTPIESGLDVPSIPFNISQVLEYNILLPAHMCVPKSCIPLSDISLSSPSLCCLPHTVCHLLYIALPCTSTCWKSTPHVWPVLALSFLYRCFDVWHRPTPLTSQCLFFPSHDLLSYLALHLVRSPFLVPLLRGSIVIIYSFFVRCP